MTQWVKFNDGEALTFGDLNDIQEFARRTAIDGILLNAASSSLPWLPNATAGEVLRPYGYAGAPIRTSATNVRLAGGLWLYNANTATLSASAPVSIVALSTAYTDLTVAAASAGMYSRDIIQTRVISGDDPTTPRDFQDAVTGALSSQSMVKRTATTVEHAIKAGVEYATETTVVEPSPDAGWIKTGSVLVSDTGIMDNSRTFDWRVPFGNSTHLVLPSNMMADPSDWSMAVDGAGWHMLNAGGLGASLGIPVNVISPAIVSGQQSPGGFFAGARRVLALDLVADLAAAAAAGTVVVTILRGDAVGYDYPPTITGAFAGNLGSRISATTLDTFALYNLGSYSTDGPLWTNGGYSALADVSDISVLSLQLEGRAVGDKIYSLAVTLAG